MFNRRNFLIAAGSLASAQSSWSQGVYPTKPVTLYVPYPAGGPGDLIARSIGEVVGERLGQPVVPDFRPGAGGQIAAAALLQNPADGLTMLLGDVTSLCTNRLLYTKFRYETLVDLEPIAPLLQMPPVLFVPKNSPHNSLADLVNAARSRDINYASQGNGSAGHLLAEMLSASAGVRFNHVAYKGSAPAMTDLMGNQVEFLFDGIGAGLQHLNSDRLKAIAVAYPHRLSQVPSVPTTAEAGHASVVFPFWFGLMAKAGTPAAIVRRLNEETLYALKQPKVLKRFTDLGFETMAMSPEAFRDMIQKETVRLTAFLKTRKISID